MPRPNVPLPIPAVRNKDLRPKSSTVATRQRSDVVEPPHVKQMRERAQDYNASDVNLINQEVNPNAKLCKPSSFAARHQYNTPVLDNQLESDLAANLHMADDYDNDYEKFLEDSGQGQGDRYEAEYINELATKLHCEHSSKSFEVPQHICQIMASIPSGDVKSILKWVGEGNAHRLSVSASTVATASDKLSADAQNMAILIESMHKTCTEAKTNQIDLAAMISNLTIIYSSSAGSPRSSETGPDACEITLTALLKTLARRSVDKWSMTTNSDISQAISQYVSQLKRCDAAKNAKSIKLAAANFADELPLQTTNAVTVETVVDLLTKMSNV